MMPFALWGALPKTLSFDAMAKEVFVSPTETNGLVSFNVTNVATKPITVFRLKPSCGCTLAEAPPRPWKLGPAESGTMTFNTSTRGKFGRLNKSATLYTSAGMRVLNFSIHIPRPLNSDSRKQNLEFAEQDRQAVFSGDCASCHARPTKHKTGTALYATACAICHDSPRRAEMVPPLRQFQLSKDQWRQVITHGKTNSLMPGFAKKHGGPLSEAQIKSLVEFLGASLKTSDVSTNSTE